MVSGRSSSFAMYFMWVALNVTQCPPKLQEQLLEGKRTRRNQSERRGITECQT